MFRGQMLIPRSGALNWSKNSSSRFAAIAIGGISLTQIAPKQVEGLGRLGVLSRV